MLTRTHTVVILLTLFLQHSFVMSVQAGRVQAVHKDTLIRRDLILEKEYVPSVDMPSKQFVLPPVEPVSLQKRAADFSLSENPASLKGFYNPLPAPSLTIDYPAQQKWGYFSFAGGSKTAFMGDAQVNVIRQSKQTLDIRLLHRSIFGDIANYMGVDTRSYMNQNRMMANYTLHIPANELTVSLGERYNAWNYYGSWKTPTTTDNLAAVSLPKAQWLWDTQYSLGVSSKDFPSKKLKYSALAQGHLFYLGKGINAPGATTMTQGGKENELKVTGNMEYAFSKGISFGANVDLTKLSYREPSTFPLLEAYYTNPASTRNSFTDQSWLQVNPFARFTWKQWMVTAGLNVSFPTLESERVKWSPTLQGSTSLSDKAAFRVSLDGKVLPQSYREGFDRNPYLDPYIHLQTAFQALCATAAFDYKPIKNLRISPQLEYAITNNKAFFYNAMPGLTDVINTTYGGVFSAKYLNENRLTIGTDAYYNFRTKLRFFTQVQYNHYMNYSKDAAFDLLMKNNRNAWYQPGFVARFRLDASILTNVSTFVDYQIAALRYAPTPTDLMHHMDDIHDLQIGVSWELAKNVQVFFRLNNLLDQRYEQWYGYKTHGFSALIGGYVTF